MLYGISYTNEIEKPIQERKQKGVNYISTSYDDIMRDDFLSKRFTEVANQGSSDYIVDMRGGLFDRQHRSVVKVNYLKNALFDTVSKGRDVEPLIRQFVAVNLNCMNADDMIKVVEHVSCNLGLDVESLCSCISSALGLLIHFKNNLFKSEHKIVFYLGMLTREYAVLLHILSNLGYDIVYVNNFVNDSEFRYTWIRKPTVQFRSEEQKANVLNTVAYNAQEEIRAILDDNLIRKENKVNDTIENSYLRCTLDEVRLYYHEALKMRPNFSKEDNKIVVPNIIGYFEGVFDDFKKYIDFIIDMNQDDKTLWFAPESNSTTHIDTQSFGYLVGKKGIIREHLNSTTFETIKEPMRTLLLNKIDELLIACSTRSAKIKLLESVLYMNYAFAEEYNNFIFTERNPKVILYNQGNEIEEHTLTFLKFLGATGWDVIILAPTQPISNWDIPRYTLGAFRGLKDTELSARFEVRKLFTSTLYSATLVLGSSQVVKVASLRELYEKGLLCLRRN